MNLRIIYVLYMIFFIFNLVEVHCTKLDSNGIPTTYKTKVT